MSIKPVAWVSGTLIAGRCAGSMAYANRNSEEQMPLYSIPDTHRVVSVELLGRCTKRLISGAKAFQILKDQFGVKNRIAPGRIACETLADELRAIIDNTPQ